jgi:glycosyltransferase involved in cell wall biosynthesis
MDGKPSVSVLINNYNYAEFMGACIDSVLSQTVPATEVIVVDDGSTDDSRRVIASYGTSVTPLLKSNEGQSSAFNAGYAASTGDVVIFLDADDLLLPTCIETVAPLFSDPVLSKVHWPMIVIDAKGRDTGKRRPHQTLPVGDLREKVIAKGPGSYLSPPTSGNAWSRPKFLSMVMPIPEIGDGHGADAFLIHLAPLYGTIGTVETPQSCYRTHEKSFTGQLLAGQIRRNRLRFDRLSDTLAEHLGRLGIAADREKWKQNSWHYRSAETLNDLERVVPAGTEFALVNDSELGFGEIVDGRRAVPLPHRDGVTWGAPASDEAALEELRRLQQSGVSILAIGWPSFWWFDHYPCFIRHLRRNADCLLENERLVVFQLRESVMEAST